MNHKDPFTPKDKNPHHVTLFADDDDSLGEEAISTSTRSVNRSFGERSLSSIDQKKLIQTGLYQSDDYLWLMEKMERNNKLLEPSTPIQVVAAAETNETKNEYWTKYLNPVKPISWAYNQLPNRPTIPIPSAPSVSIPSVSMPSVSMPSVSFPSVLPSAPTLGLAKLGSSLNPVNWFGAKNEPPFKLFDINEDHML